MKLHGYMNLSDHELVDHVRWALQNQPSNLRSLIEELITRLESKKGYK